jgi:hypothetical protein
LADEGFMVTMGRSIVRIGMFLVMAGTGIVASTQQGAANSPARQVIRLHCAPALVGVPAQDAEMLCRQMGQALAAAAPGKNIRRVPGDQIRPGSPTELSVVLQIEGPSQATLSWQKGPEGVRHKGRAARLDGPIAGADPARLRAYADHLVSIAGPLTKMLQKTSK